MGLIMMFSDKHITYFDYIYPPLFSTVPHTPADPLFFSASSLQPFTTFLL